MSYAEKTNVPVERSRAEIERLITRYGAEKFASGWARDAATIMFEMAGRRVRFNLPMPDASEKRFTHYRHGRNKQYEAARSETAVKEAYEQEVRRRWRALSLVIKAKLEAVESGISVFEDEFMANIVMPDGKTVSEHARPWIESAYQSKNVLALPGW